MQFVVISLKTGLFQNSEALVGIYRDQAANSSRTLTLDVSSLCFPCSIGGSDRPPIAPQISISWVQRTSCFRGSTGWRMTFQS
jgi:hypothetical protein